MSANKIKRFLLGAFAAVMVSAPLALPVQFSEAQSISQPANPDTMFCTTRGSIATRLATRWQCLTPGTSGQVLKTNGPGADVAWLTIPGTGTVTSVAATVPAFMSVAGSPITTSGTLAITANTQTAATILAGPTTGVPAVPAFRALATTDLPAIPLTTGVTGVLPIANGGTNASTASGTSLDNITGFSTTGILRRTGAGTYTLGTTVSVAEGGTNATSASGTALDNITGFSTTGVMQRTGAGAYSFSTIPAILGSQTANQIFAAPNGSAGNPAFRAMVSADIPSSVALAGSPTTTTQAPSDNSTNIATTAFVQQVVANGPTVVTQSSDQAVTTTTLANNASLQFTLSASTRYWIDGEFYFTSTGANAGAQLGYNLPAAVNAVAANCEASFPTTGLAYFSANSTSSGQHSIFSAGSTSSSGVLGHAHCSIMVDVSTTGGTFAMSYAAATGGAGTGATMLRGSHITYKSF